jgi:hypothetical protein
MSRLAAGGGGGGHEHRESLCHDTDSANFSRLEDLHRALYRRGRVSRSNDLVLGGDNEPIKFKDEVVDWTMQQLFGYENPRFAILRIPFSAFGSSSPDTCFDNAYNNLLPNLLGDILDRCKKPDFKYRYMFPAEMRQYGVAGKHKKWKDGVWPSGPRQSLKLHWDPLSLPILGTVYHKDENVDGGNALVSDLAHYLRDHGGSVANGVYAKGLLHHARVILESNKYMKMCPIGKQPESSFDSITLQLVNNHIDLADYRKCGVLHTNQGSGGTGFRRVALVSIQDTGELYKAYMRSEITSRDGTHQYAEFPYITPPFRALARAQLNEGKIKGYFDCEEGPTVGFE